MFIAIIANVGSDNLFDPFTGEPISKAEVDEVQIRITMAPAIEAARHGTIGGNQFDRAANAMFEALRGADVRLLARAYQKRAATDNAEDKRDH
jgi:hypothetical protein